jgi:hypothetical protein
MHGHVGQTVVYQRVALTGIYPQAAGRADQHGPEAEVELAERPLVLTPERGHQRRVSHRGTPSRHLAPARSLMIHGSPVVKDESRSGRLVAYDS